MAPHPGHLLARLRFRHLQLISEVERTGSLTRAAIALSLTQPALSKALKEIEEMLGFSIFQRGSRGLIKTSQGKVVVQGAALLLRELLHIQAEAEAAGADGRLAAVLRLGTSAFLAVGLLPPVIARLARLSVAVQLREDNVPRLFEALLAGELDALVTLYNPDVMNAAVSREVRFERLAEEPYVVIAPHDHRLARARVRTPTWEELAGEPWVLTRRPSLARVLLEDSFRRHGAVPPEPLCETDGPVTAAQLVAHGVGLSSVPESTARELLTRAAIGRVRMKQPQASATLGLVFRAASAEHPRIALLRQALSR